MKAKDLRNSILQLAVQGKLVPQDPNDEPAAVLLERIRAERAKLIKEKKIKAPKDGESFIYRASDGSHYEKRGKGEPVCIDDEIPFEIPESWEWVRLESVCRVITDGDHQPPPQVTEGVPFLVISNVSSGSISFENTRYVPSTYFEALDDSRKPEVGDLLFTVTGSFGIPVVVRTDREFCFQRHIALLKPLIDVDYLWWAVQSPSFFNYCDLKATGTAQRTVSLSTLRSGLLPIPPAAEQTRIISFISKLFPYVDEYGSLESARERLDTELPDKLRKSILQLAVQGKLVAQAPSDEPASALLDLIRAERAALVKAGKLKAPKGGESVIYRTSDGGYYEKRGKGEPVCIDDEIPFVIPESWAWARLGSVVLNRAQLKPSSDFCYIDIGSIDNAMQKLNDEETVIAAKDAPSRARKPVAMGDVLYSTVRPYLHNACIVDREFSHMPIASTGFAAMVCPAGFSEAYLLCLLISPFFDAYANDNENAKGVAYPAINDARLYNALVPVPPSNEQIRIVSQFKMLENSIG